MERVFKKDGLIPKILCCLLITMYALMCLYGSSVYATSYTYTRDDGVTYIYPNTDTISYPSDIDDYPFFIAVVQNNVLHLWYSTNEFYYDTSSGYFTGYSFDTSSYYHFTGRNGAESFSSQSFKDFMANWNFLPFNSVNGPILFTNFDLKDQSGNVFFQKSEIERGTEGNTPSTDSGEGGNEGSNTGDNENTSDSDDDTGFLSSLTQGFKNVIEFIEKILNFLNPFSDDFFLKKLFAWVENIQNNVSNEENEESVFTKIGKIFNFINPFSEDFFAYKLIDLLVDALKNLFTFLFVPSEERLTAIINTVKEKFDFLQSLSIASNSMKDMLNNIGNAPKLTLNLKASKYTEAQNMVVFDLNWYAPYKPYGDLLFTGFIYLMFLWRLLASLPNIINAVGSSAPFINDAGKFSEETISKFLDD